MSPLNSSQHLPEESNTQLARRQFLRNGSLGIGSVALSWMLAQEDARATPKNVPKENPKFDLTLKQSHFEPRARAMISLFQH